MEIVITVYSHKGECAAACLKVLTGLIALASLTAGLSLVLPEGLGVDWVTAFYPAARLAFSRQDPYSCKLFMNPPWALVLFAPLALLPVQAGISAMAVLGFAAYAWAAVRLGARPLGLALLILSPQVMSDLTMGNINWLSVLGFVLPPQLGIFLVLLKPQVGIGIAVFWAVEALRKKRFIRTFAPFAVTVAVSLLIYPHWPLAMLQGGVYNQWNNMTLFPLSVPFGLAALYYAIRSRDARYAYPAAPALAPHVMLHSWVAVLLPLLADTRLLAVAVGASWLLVAYLTIR